MDHPRSFTISAPASSGNLGPGFDVFGMALELRNRVRARPGSGRVTVNGEGAGDLPADATNLVARAFERAAGQTILELELDLECHNVIPPARGLGSSTAAAACGLIAGWHATGSTWDEAALTEHLTELDGHPDNAGACAWGGVVLCHDRPDDAGMDVIPLGSVDWLTLLAVIPDRQLATAEARRLVPTTVELHDVVRSLGGIAVLSAGLVGGHPELLADALHTDVLHEPHRAALVPELAEVRSCLHVTSALGATLSGAGPTVLVWCEPADADQARGTLAIEFPDLRVEQLAVAEVGARVEA